MSSGDALDTPEAIAGREAQRLGVAASLADARAFRTSAHESALRATDRGLFDVEVNCREVRRFWLGVINAYHESL